MRTYTVGDIVERRRLSIERSQEEYVPVDVARGLHEALDRAADDLAMIARVEKNYLAKSGADRCRAALAAADEEGG